jgi:WhiB family redox-sensing transcriptional regulator
MTKTGLAPTREESVPGGLRAFEWMRHGACTERPDLPWVGDNPSALNQRRMRVVCAGCPVLAECAEFVIVGRVSHGMWAGTWMREAKAWRIRAGHRRQRPGAEGARAG